MFQILKKKNQNMKLSFVEIIKIKKKKKIANNINNISVF